MVSLSVNDAEYVGQEENWAATLPEWPRAKALARKFWQAVAQDTRISSEFKAISAQNSAYLAP